MSSINVTPTVPATVKFKLTDGNGAPVASAVITIATQLKLGVFPVGTVLTDSTGVATATLSATPRARRVRIPSLPPPSWQASRSAEASRSRCPAVEAAAARPRWRSRSPRQHHLLVAGDRDDEADRFLGKPVTGAVVTIGTQLGLGVFSVGTVLTDSTGKATALLSANSAGTAGADTITASATIGTATVTGGVAFQVSGGGSGASPTLAVSLSSNNITPSAPATATFKLTDAAGAAVPGAIVTISTQLGQGVFSVATVLTDSSGVASAVLKANSAGTAGADTVTASAKVGTSTVTGSVNFQVAGGGAGTSPTLGVTISSTTVTATTPATVTFTLKDVTGLPLANTVVSISTSRKYAVFAVATVLTNSAGVASAQLQVGPSGTAGADEVVATAAVGSSTITGSVAYQVTGGTVAGTAPAKVEVVASANSVGSGASSITITAIVKGANNVAIPSTPVSFATSTGTLASAATATDATGAATAQFSAGQDKTNRTATITVTAGGAIGTISIDITGTQLVFSGPTTLTQGATATISVKATDSLGNPIGGQSISVKGTLTNIATGTSITTDSSGAASLTYHATASGTDTLTISGLGVTISPAIAVSGQDFSFTSPAPGATVNIGASQQVTVKFVNGSAPGVGYVRFTSTAGTFSTPSGVTLVGGIASATLSSNFAGPATVQASLYATSTSTASIAQASLPLQFVATSPATLTLQVTPSAIGPNSAGSTSHQAAVQATVLDAFGNPVANVAVNFSRTADPSGGNLSQASALTNANGVAKVQYISGAQSTSTGGVVLKAVVAPNPSVTGTTTLTVNQSALFIALGTGNVITNVNPTTYLKQYTAYVTDSTGAAVPNVTLTVSAIPRQYGKGTFAWNGTAWASAPWLGAAGADLSATANVGHNISCANEDTNTNGVLDLGPPSEDINGDGKLEPGNVISVSGGSSVTTVQTDSTGFALINLEYAESYAYWVQIDLKVGATVSGTESSNDAIFWVPGLSTDYTVQTVAPAGQTSPFGVIASCTNPN